MLCEVDSVREAKDFCQKNLGSIQVLFQKAILQLCDYLHVAATGKFLSRSSIFYSQGDLRRDGRAIALVFIASSWCLIYLYSIFRDVQEKADSPRHYINFLFRRRSSMLVP